MSRGPLDLAIRAGFRAGAALRGARAFHPKGVAYRATAVVDAANAPPGMPVGSFEAVLRFSRGAGLPDALPDVHGIAVKLLDACGAGCDQDLLLASAGSGRLTRHLLVPYRAFGSRVHSTLLPYRGGGSSHVVGARFAEPVAGGLPELERVVADGRALVELLVAAPSAPWRPLGHVQVRPERLPDEEERALSYDPWHTAEGFVPSGFLNRLRRPAYNASRQGRPFGHDHEPEPGRP